MVQTAADPITGAENVTWDLSIFYAGGDDPAISADMERVTAMADDFAARYRGKVASMTAAEMVAAMQELEAIYDLSGRVSSFAFLNFSTDTADPLWSALVQRVTEHGAALQQKLLFFELEWRAVDETGAEKLLADPALGKYRHYLESER
ncbi:MAG: oligoendopeptidase F, partial [Phototrophicales bacterium]